LTTYASQVDDVQVTRHELTGELVDVIYARLSFGSERFERANRLSNAGVFRNSIEVARRQSGLKESTGNNKASHCIAKPLA